MPSTLTALDGTCRGKACEDGSIGKSQQVTARALLSWRLLPETWHFQPLYKDVTGFHCLLPRVLPVFFFFLSFLRIPGRLRIIIVVVVYV